MIKLQLYIVIFYSRYDKAVDPNEDSYEITTKVDQYGFAVLVEDLFKGHTNGKRLFLCQLVLGYPK